MKKARIEYRYLRFFRKTKILHLPEEWTDLTDRQFAACAKMYTETVTDAAFIAAFFGIKKSLARRMKPFLQYRLLDTVGFIASPQASVNFFYLRKIPGTNLVAPENRLKNINFEHFMIFDSLFFDYLGDANAATKKEEALSKFIAALYIKKKETVTKIDIDLRAGYIAKKVDKAMQYAIFLNYTFIRRWLALAYPFLFGFADEAEPEKDKRKPRSHKKTNRPDWIDFLDTLVGDDIVHYEKYRQMACNIIFRTANKRIKNYTKHGNSKRF
jgi:hypothetical protein